jgi:hypothetical protein
MRPSNEPKNPRLDLGGDQAPIEAPHATGQQVTPEKASGL